VLKNPVFNADEVESDMLKRLQASIDSSENQIMIVLYIDRTFLKKGLSIQPFYSKCV
jgi:hypothetical protein